VQGYLADGNVRGKMGWRGMRRWEVQTISQSGNHMHWTLTNSLKILATLAQWKISRCCISCTEHPIYFKPELEPPHGKESDWVKLGTDS